MDISKKDLDELLAHGVITLQTRDDIAAYINQKFAYSHKHRIFSVFGILSALLIGLGIILILAHNWDDFPRSVRTFLSFLPLVAGQGLCAYSFFFRKQSKLWAECSSTLLVMAIGASISLIAQIYNIDGDFRGFMTTWLALSIPLVYLMRSSMASLLSIVGATALAVSSGSGYPHKIPFEYLIFIAALVPHYLDLAKTREDSNFTGFHHRFIAISLLIALFTFGDRFEQYTLLSYLFALSIYYLIGESPFFERQRFWSNPFRIISVLGIPLVLLATSFEGFWKLQLRQEYDSRFFVSGEFFTLVSLVGLYSYLLVARIRSKNLSEIDVVPVLSIVFTAAFFLGYLTSLAVIVPNLLILGIGLWYVRKGLRANHLGILNFGLLIIAALAACRFFDTDIPFVVRGLMFVSVGAGFTIANIKLIKMRSTHE